MPSTPNLNRKHFLTLALTKEAAPHPLTAPPKMAFTMHSHSGEFCPGHAVDTLEAIILRAIALGFQTIGLTEHMPRIHIDDLYPEEVTPPPP